MHDSSYKFLFSQPELVRDLIAGFVPDDWLHSLDYSTLEKVSGSYITEDFRHRADDIVWRVRAGEEWVYLYLLLEFQSSVDRYMALRVMVYVGLLYQDLLKSGQTLPDGRLPYRTPEPATRHHPSGGLPARLAHRPPRPTAALCPLAACHIETQPEMPYRIAASR
jgi:predicted transposase YdaD